MKTTTRGFVTGLAVIGVALTVQAAESGTGDVNRTWTLTTDDTELTLAVTDHTISIVSLRKGWFDMLGSASSQPFFRCSHQTTVLWDVFLRAIKHCR